MARSRLLGLLFAAALLAVGAIPVSATSEGLGYLALGDSVAFGFNLCTLSPSVPSNCQGYPEHLAQMLNIEDVNASCPGEASGGFISLTGTDNGCRTFRFFPNFLQLHVAYSTSQLDFAVSFLKNNPRTRLVTIDIGANDLFVLLRTCAQPGAPADCFATGFPVLLGTLAHNLGVIYTAIRAAGFSGLLVALKYYVVNYTNATAVQLLSAINNVVAAVTDSFGGFAADGFTAFQKASASFGGDTISAGLVRPGDIHPTAIGHTLLAQTILNTIAATCPAASPIGCFARSPQ